MRLIGLVSHIGVLGENKPPLVLDLLPITQGRVIVHSGRFVIIFVVFGKRG